MSMPALLSHFGINAARYVTTSGEIIFDGVTMVGSGFTHATHGAVTPVARHTFHGAEDEPDDSHHGATVWWDDENQVSRHVEAMQKAFPGFAYVPPEDGSGPCWGGTIDTGRGTFEIGIFPRRDQGLPRVVVFNRRLGAQAGRKWEKPPHLYLNGNLCVAEVDDWDPAEHTVATVTAWAAHWLAAYTEWRMERLWPVEGVHAVAS
jgi:hypothetical protein